MYKDIVKSRLYFMNRLLRMLAYSRRVSNRPFSKSICFAGTERHPQSAQRPSRARLTRIGANRTVEAGSLDLLAGNEANHLLSRQEIDTN
jgi:hypothetical protein